MPEPRFSFNFDVNVKVTKDSDSQGCQWPEKLTEDLRNVHLTAGITDAESALNLTPHHQNSTSKTCYVLAQLHQLNGDWKSALTFFDLALEQCDLAESWSLNLEWDRNVCLLEVLNQTEVEEFNWIPGQKQQTMAGVTVRRPRGWSSLLQKWMGASASQPYQLRGQVIKANFLAQGLSWEAQDKDKAKDKDKENKDLIKKIKMFKGRKHKQQIKDAVLLTKMSANEQQQQTIVVPDFEVDFEEVVQLYEGAARGGLPSGLYNLGLLLQEGNGVRQADFSSAIRLFYMAALFPISDNDDDNDKRKSPYFLKDGVLEAQYRLGLCYEFGLGVGKDEKKALHWYEKASLGDFAKASRKLGEIYHQGLLGVPKDDALAMFSWIHAATHGDTGAMTSIAFNLLRSSHLSCFVIEQALYSFSRAIDLNCRDGTDTMLAAMLDRKQNFQCTLSTLLHNLTNQNQPESEQEQQQQPGSDCKNKVKFDLGFGSGLAEKNVEPEGVSWTVPAFIEHTLRTIHLLELVQTPGFLEKLEGTSPNWRSELPFTDRLLVASNACVEGLAALVELNKLYRDHLTKGRGGPRDTEYPPDLRKMSGVNKTVLARETRELVTLILSSFSNSIRLVGAAFLRDHLTQHLILGIVRKTCGGKVPIPGDLEQKIYNYFDADLILSYTTALKGVDWEEGLEMIEQNYNLKWKEYSFIEPFITISGAAVQGSLGKFEVAAGGFEQSLKILSQDPQHRFFMSKGDLLFVQAVCCKAAGLTRGINSGVNRKKVKEAIVIFGRFLAACSKDDPRRAEAYYQISLCTFYLENMKVKGQGQGFKAVSSCTAKDILDKILPHFVQGAAAELDLPWKGQFSYESPVKLSVQQKIQELQALVEIQQNSNPKNSTSQNISTNVQFQNRACFGVLVDPTFKFPTSSLILKLRESRRVGVVTKFRKFFKTARETRQGSKSSSICWCKLQPLMNILKGPCVGADMVIESTIVGCYEIVEPVFPVRLTPTAETLDHWHSELNLTSEEQARLNMDKIQGFTVVQDESGAVFNLHLSMEYRKHLADDQDTVGEIGEFRMGARIIVHRPRIWLNEEGETNLYVPEAGRQIFHLPSDAGRMRKCGFCGKIREKLQLCAKCQIMAYCSKECQTADWKELKHSWVCPFLLPCPGI